MCVMYALLSQMFGLPSPSFIHLCIVSQYLIILYSSDWTRGGEYFPVISVYTINRRTRNEEEEDNVTRTNYFCNDSTGLKYNSLWGSGVSVTSVRASMRLYLTCLFASYLQYGSTAFDEMFIESRNSDVVVGKWVLDNVTRQCTVHTIDNKRIRRR